MNAIPKFSKLMAATFPDLQMSSDFEVEDQVIYFTLEELDSSMRQVVAITGQITGTETTDTCAWNNTSDPQNEVDVPFDLIQIEKYHVATIYDFDNALVIEGQPFLLTDRQRDELNEMLKEHFEELKLKEIKKLEEQGEEV